MKIFLAIIFGLLLAGCSADSSKEQKHEPEMVQEITQKQTAVTIKKEVVVTQIEAKLSNDVYKRCISCHGAKAEKKAMNQSQVIAGWSYSRLVKALNGYKNGSYGANLKAVMKAQVANMKKREIESVSDFISKL